MPALSAGIAMYRYEEGSLRVLLIHPGGPYWRNKEEGAWMIPKGMVEQGEDPEQAARREFAEELGSRIEGEVVPLGRIRQAGGKWVEAFAIEGELDPETVVSNHYQVEFPPRSGKFRSYPEVDRAAWFPIEEARRVILPSQAPLLDSLESLLADDGKS